MSATINLLFAGFLILCRFIPGAPNPDSLFAGDSVSKEQLVTVYSQLCRSYLAHPKLKDINVAQLMDLIATANTSPTAPAKKIFQNLEIKELITLYKDICKENPNPNALDAFDFKAILQAYKQLQINLPDHHFLKIQKLKETAHVLAANGAVVGELSSPGNRRAWIPLSEIPEIIQQAFISAEDRNFYSHKGVDEFGVLRAFGKYMMSGGRPEGGSTITQQVAKNLLVGDDLTLERKFREMLVAEKMEKDFSKKEILEIYLNLIFLGRNTWGLQLASQSYFGKHPNQLTLTESAMLAGITKGPSHYDPFKNQRGVLARRAYVLKRLFEDGVITEAQMDEANKEPLKVLENRIQTGLAPYFVDALKVLEAKKLKALRIESQDVRIHSTLFTRLQEVSDNALRHGLDNFELRTARNFWRGPIKNLKDEISAMEHVPVNQAMSQKGEARSLFSMSTDSPQETKEVVDELEEPDDKTPAWQRVLSAEPATLLDLDWEKALVLSKGGSNILVGLKDGRVKILSSKTVRNATFKYGDLIYVERTDRGIELRQVPEVQGAVVVMNPYNGMVLALSGGYSFGASPFNRASQGFRQPGSALKPFTYLAALDDGLTPQSRIADLAIYFPPIARGGKSWSPHNYDGRQMGMITLQTALEQSRNIATARVMSAVGLDRVRSITQEFGIYNEPERYYPFILGAQPTTLLRMVTAYSIIANGGRLVKPHFILAIENKDRRPVFGLQEMLTQEPPPPSSVKPESFFQLRQMMQGVLMRGTARAIHDLSDSVAGKTGTSDNERDAWFIGMSNDLVVGVYVGYDNARGQTAKTLGAGSTGGSVALPIFSEVIRKSFEVYAPRKKLSDTPMPINYNQDDIRYTGDGW